MKKIIKVFLMTIFSFVFFSVSVSALSNDQIMEQFVLVILNSMEQNNWVRNDEGIKVLIANVNSSEEITDGFTFNDLYIKVDNKSGGKKTYYYVYPCITDTCDKEVDSSSVDIDNMIKFQIQQKDSIGNVYAVATNVTDEKINKIQNGNNFYYAESYGPWTSNSKYKGYINGGLIKSLLEKGNDFMLDMKCTYDLGGGYKYQITYDCTTIKNNCLGDYRCNISKTDITEKYLQASNGEFKCPSKVYYIPTFGDIVNTVNSYEIVGNKDYTTKKHETANLISEESSVTGGKNSCKKAETENPTENYTYDFTCKYPDFYLNFNKGDTYASVQTNLEKYKGLRVNLNDSSKCPPSVYVMCSGDINDVCSISTSQDHLGLSSEHKLVTDSTNIPNAEELEEKNQKENNNPKIGFSPTKLCESEENCNIDLDGFCAMPTVSRTLRFLGLLFSIVKILVPAIIIIMGIVNLVKIITSGKEEEVKKSVKSIGMRVIIGVGIFLLPGIVKFIFTTADDIISRENASTFKNCYSCILSPDSEDCIVTTYLED